MQKSFINYSKWIPTYLKIENEFSIFPYTIFYFSKNFLFKNHPSTSLATSSNSFKHPRQLLYDTSYISKKEKKELVLRTQLLKPLPTYSNVLIHEDSLRLKIINRKYESRDNDQDCRSLASSNGAKGTNFTGHVAVNQASHRGWPRGRATERIFAQTVRTDFHGNRKQGSGR